VQGAVRSGWNARACMHLRRSQWRRASSRVFVMVGPSAKWFQWVLQAQLTPVGGDPVVTTIQNIMRLWRVSLILRCVKHIVPRGQVCPAVGITANPNAAELSGRWADVSFGSWKLKPSIPMWMASHVWNLTCPPPIKTPSASPGEEA
jgi:hypothetical protein